MSADELRPASPVELLAGVENPAPTAADTASDAGDDTSLAALLAEHAAVRLGAHVTDTESVRQLVRRDCRRRGVKVRTFATHNIIVVYDDARRDAFLETEEGQAHADAMTERMLHAFDDLIPDPPPRLRAVPPPDEND